jgi:hypothetical protein
VGLNLLGLSDERENLTEASWWDDPMTLLRQRREFESAMRFSEPEQVELWRDPALREATVTPRPARRDVATAITLTPVAKLSEDIQKVAEEDIHPEKGNGMSMFAIAKFLHISGSLYDGDDERRWLALPRSKSRMQYQLTQNRLSSTDNCRTLRSMPRDFSSRANGTWLSA